MTIVEVEAKKTNLEATIATALEASKVLAPGTVEFDEAYGRYLAAKSSLAKIPEELAVAKKAENAAVLATDSATIAAAVMELATGLDLASKLGEPIRKIVIDVLETGAVATLNPVVKVKATGGTRESKAGGRTQIGYPDGSTKSPTKFVLEFATEAEKATAEYKYPHTRVDSKPKFEAFCTGHSLTGYTYIVPGKAEVEATS